MDEKQILRRRFRKERSEHVAQMHVDTQALILRRPPAPLLSIIPPKAAIGLYHATGDEAPACGYARYFSEAGHALALPHLDQRRGDDSAQVMEFREWTDPWDNSDLAPGPFGIAQPSGNAALIEPDVVFLPLVAFTPDGCRLGQGGGFYDRLLARHPALVAIGLAWDVQCTQSLPMQPHDQPLDAVVTPTRLYGPFEKRRR
ncbi:5-formyltetrahydrofolate cyclo-ligase [Croceicoccus sp. F390]|uniref:5-formyltetrahydrofolate cyclo-ligase n=1 Tax=Croceicoccus esteveae TaxID=3075597 RepID=A0ABU2ZKL3_9SPHN|nr:5-formyltetrahydrofolate cyclo-ligase [Croceicoccus sp. F390]MDT0576915.1 5-formyltetrahydrofolate cyclo-ligase [Croceicoccus sp. F390]